MTFETATQLGLDLIAPAVTIFTIGYAFQPWYSSHIGRAIMAHCAGSLILFDLAALAQHGYLPSHVLEYHWVTLTMVTLWVFGWWYMVVALVLTLRTSRKGGDRR